MSEEFDPELTRRLWMLTVGQTAIGLGIVRIARGQTGASNLPPGLYLPSTDHLGHALMSESRFHPIPPDSPTDYVKPGNAPFKPLFFSPAEFAVIRRITELILGGGTNTSVIEEVAEWIDLSVFSAAGVREAALNLDAPYHALAVAYYGTDRVREIETHDPQKICREGLAWLAEESQSRHSADFVNLAEKDQLEILTLVSDERADKHVENAGTRFFKLIKFDVIRGFYTSKTGLKELDYKGNGFYAASPGCKTKAT